MIKCICDRCGRNITPNPKHIDVDLFNEELEAENDHVKIEFDLCTACYINLRQAIVSNLGTSTVTVNPLG